MFPNSSTPVNPSTYSAFLQLLERAESSLELSSSYWTLRGSDIDFEDPTAWQGEDVFKRIKNLATSKNIKIRITQNLPGKGMPNKDTDDLSKVRNKAYSLSNMA